MFPTAWYQIYYKTAKISKNWNLHFMIWEVVSDLIQGYSQYAGKMA